MIEGFEQMIKFSKKKHFQTILILKYLMKRKRLSF